MAAENDTPKDKTQLWEVLTILLIWLLAAAMVYIIFYKVRIAINS
jgi:flagellar basal body-associated protein FliL